MLERPIVLQVSFQRRVSMSVAGAALWSANLSINLNIVRRQERLLMCPILVNDNHASCDDGDDDD